MTSALSVLIIAAAVLAGIAFLLWVVGLRIIPSNKVGIVEKWWSTKGSLNEQIIALRPANCFRRG